MQQTVDADANVTKDLTDVDAVLETILVSGLSYFFYSVVAMAVVQAVAVSDAMIAVSGLSSYSSSVADSVATAVVLTVADVDVAATICAANLS